MKLLSGAASLLALALFVAPVVAQNQTTTSDPSMFMQVAQAAAVVPDEVLALLADTRPSSELSDQELKSRAKLAKQFSQDDSLSDEMRIQLDALAEAAKNEINNREQAAKPAEPAPAPVVEEKQPEPAPAPVVEEKQPEPAPAPVVEEKQPEPAPAPVVEEKQPEPAPAIAAPAVEAAIPEEVSSFLGDTRAAADLTDDELNVRAKTARRFAKSDKLPQETRDELTAVAAAAHDEFVKRQTQAQEKPAEVVPEKQTEQQPDAVPAIDPPKEQPAIVLEAPPADAAQPAVVEAAPPAPAKADVQALDNNAGDPAAEKLAQAYLNDTTPLENMSDEDLRSRLDGIRDVMAGNTLSSETEQAVRKKLTGEREFLRQRLAAKEAATAAKVAAEAPAPKPLPPLESIATAVALPPAPPPPPPLPPVQVNNTTVTNNTTVNNTVVITNITPAPIVLRDTRPAEELQVAELQRRLRVYEEAQFDDEYDQANRDYWRQSIVRDREILRRRMASERRRRAEQLALNAGNDDFDITINFDFSPSRPPPPRYVFAAEVDEQELEEVLIAPPRKSIKKRYNVDEIAVEPRLRESVSRIEIDTIRFGTNQAFVREEQLSSLDGIAAIIERIVKKYPKEVFLIEGHTDAPGSNIYNAKLSKLRAEAIKAALVSYYVIPARNLRTVGLGERFLKIPTAEAEGENRRVSISRITPLLASK